MKVVKYPSSQDWKTLTKRPEIARAELNTVVSDVLKNNRRRFIFPLNTLRWS